MDDLLEDGNVSQGAAMDVFATLFVVFILILVVSMVLHGGYSVDREKGFIYVRYWIKNAPATKYTPVFQLHVYDQGSKNDRAWLVFDESLGEITRTKEATSETLGAVEAGMQRAFIVRRLPASSYSLDLVLCDGLQDLWPRKTSIEICWELFLPLGVKKNGCDTVVVTRDTSTLTRIPIDYDLSIR